MKTWKNSPQMLLKINNQQFFLLSAWLPKRPRSRNRNFIGFPCLLYTISLVDPYHLSCLIKKVIGENNRPVKGNWCIDVNPRINHDSNSTWHMEKKKSHWKKNYIRKEMVFCYQNCSDQLWEKIVLVIGKNLKIKKFWDH